MDAQTGDWVVTPRRGRTVELNALWFNALMTGSRFAAKLGEKTAARQWDDLAQKVRASFNRRFWNSKMECCFDVIADDAADASLRPNQLFQSACRIPFWPPNGIKRSSTGSLKNC